ncbi:hypothetical protein [Caldovatus aquaticus]|uniref:Uncharacterized protein n=1 Tax=Caldovatus aquaticus TaxID=2865671 RepID=A0ABS7EZQ1_9PROT|nr:hypothetical protein [Caldovatus aquaticus]MBW8268784.1 hypothetical protein [Caldovatus aquaticus]
MHSGAHPGEEPSSQASAAGPRPLWGRGAVAGALAAVLALTLINLVALPALPVLLPPTIAFLVLICAAGPAIEEACKYAAFRLTVRHWHQGWRSYWALGLTFGVLEAMLKLAPAEPQQHGPPPKGPFLSSWPGP